MPIRVPPRRL